MSLSKNNYREAFDKLIHDIKNPIGRMRTRLEMALEGDAAIDDYKSAISYCYETSDKILKLMDTLADIYRAELREVKIMELSLPQAIKEVLALYDLMAEEKKLTIKLTTNASENSSLIKGDPKLIKRMLANLIENAIKFCEPGNEILINTNFSTDFVEIKISDNGLAIPSQELPYVWDRMYRGNKARELIPEGLGLGLTLVKVVAEAHHGSVTARSPIIGTRGAEFVISLNRNFI